MNREVEKIDYVICRICLKKLKQITWMHLKSHGIDSVMYRKRFPDSEMTSGETRNRLAESHEGQVPWCKDKKLTPEHRANIGNSNKGKCKGRIPWNKGLTRYTDERVAKVVEYREGKTYEEIVGEERAVEWKKTNRRNMKLLWQNLGFVNKVREGQISSRNNSPNNLEQFFSELLSVLGLSNEIGFVGDGSCWITFKNGRHKNPDFKVRGKKKVVELFGDYWHSEEFCRLKGYDESDWNSDFMENLYSEIGYECLVLWESEVYKCDSRLIRRIENFVE